MRRSAILTLAAWVILCGATATVRAQQPGTGETAEPPRPQPPRRELLHGAIDPFDPITQRASFFAAAGVDNELTRAEAEADRARGDGFMRSFDRWEQMVRFDRDRNGTLDWFEAYAYRQALRQKVFELFDEDRDGLLNAQERARANAALAAGNVLLFEPERRPRPGGPGDDGPLTPAGTIRGAAAAEEIRQRQELIERFNRRGEAALSEQELTLARRALFEDAQERRREQAAAAWAAGQVPFAPEPDERPMEQILVHFFDDSGTGELSEEERRSAEDFGRQFGRVFEGVRDQILDLDGDGTVSDRERVTAMLQLTGAQQRWQQRMEALADADGDGQVTREEWRQFHRRNEQIVANWIYDFASPYANPQTGSFGPAERRQVLHGLQAYWQERIEDYARPEGRPTIPNMMRLLEDLAEEVGLVPPLAE